MTGHDPRVSTAANYRAFANLEAHGRSPRYEALAAAVADDETVLAFLASLPQAKRQPNLLFAVARYLLGRPADIGSLRKLVTEGGQRVTGTGPYAPVIPCEPRGPVPVPDRMPEIAWRAGLDLNPLDVTDADDVRWLESLVWPGERDRAERLAGAIATARHDPPHVHRGDLLTDVPALARQAPADATLVIYHSAVLAFVDSPQRRQFASTVSGLGAVWLSNEAPGVLHSVRLTPHEASSFILVRDGTTPIAFTDPHGTWLRWLR